MLEHLAHVVARRKVAARTAQDDQTDGLGLARDGIGVHLESFEHVFAQGIQFLGAIQRERRRATVILPADQIVHTEVPPFDSTSRRRAPETEPPCRNNGWPQPAPNSTLPFDRFPRR